MKDYKYHFGLKLRIYPDYQQRKIIKMSSAASRFVYNEMVYINLELWKFGNPKIYISGVSERIKQLKGLKESASQLKDRYYWLRDKNVDSLAIDNAKLNYQKAWKMYKQIDSHGTPQFKRKSYIETYQTNPHYKAKEEALLTQQLLQFERTGLQIGIDLNVENFYADSFGNIVDNPRYYKKIRRRLKNAQRKLSRRILRAKKDSRVLATAKNVQYQRTIVAKLTAKVMRRRDAFQHILSVARFGRCRGTEDHALAQSIQDVGWRSFLSKLEYKAK